MALHQILDQSCTNVHQACFWQWFYTYRCTISRSLIWHWVAMTQLLSVLVGVLMCSGTGSVCAWEGLLPTSHAAHVSLHHSSGYQWPCTQGRKMRYSAVTEKTPRYARWHLGNQNYLHQIAGDIFISSTASGLWLGNDCGEKKKSRHLIVMSQMWPF